MSTRVMDACWGLRMPPTEKAVLMSLADQANDSGVCWPSVGSLCERTCLGERTVQRALRALEAAGVLRCAVGAMKSNRYTLDVAHLKRLERAREEAREMAVQGGLTPPEQSVTTPATVAPRHSGTPASVAPHPRHSGTQTVIEPIQEYTPHTPQPSAGGLAGVAAQGGPTAPTAPSDPPAPAPVPTPAPPAAPVPAPPKPKARREGRPALGMAAWLAQVAEAGGKAIPPDDPVYRYAATVRIGEDLLLLCWREFKRRQMAGSKRQKDWRQTFRNCVQGSWYRLWYLKGDEPAQLTSAGEQVRRFFEAEDEAQRGREGGEA